jgi:hypothetical protein
VLAIIQASLVIRRSNSGVPTERGELATVGPLLVGGSSTVASTDCRLRGDFSRMGCRAFRISSASQRATSPNQNALSLALPASAARRRHSSARRRKCSTLNCFLPPDRPTSLLYLRSETQDLFQSSLPRKAICFPAAQLNVKKIQV